MSLHPHYFPREFTSAAIIIIALYIPPSAAADVACDTVHPITARQQIQHRNAFIAVLGDFNHASVFISGANFLSVFELFNIKNLDLLYANMKNTYTSSSLHALVRSDHNLVLLTPTYTPIIQ